MRSAMTSKSGDLGSKISAAARKPSISPELSEVLHMLNSLEDRLASGNSAK